MFIKNVLEGILGGCILRISCTGKNKYFPTVDEFNFAFFILNVNFIKTKLIYNLLYWIWPFRLSLFVLWKYSIPFEKMIELQQL